MPRRWVIYRNLAEASQIPPEWHGWMHYLVDTPPTEENYVPRPWQKPHRMNMTGTPQAYRPSRQHPGHRQAAGGDRRLQALAAALRRALVRHAGATLSRPPRCLRDCAATPLRQSNRHPAWRTPHTSAAQGGPSTRRLAAVAALALLVRATPAAAQRIENSVAVFAALDKVTAKISRLEVPLNQTATFGALKVTPRVCYSRAPTEPPKTTTFVEVDETQLDGKEKRIFTGWMFADSPGLNAVEHPVFDVWLTDCTQPRATAQRPAATRRTAGDRSAGAAPPSAAPDPNDSRPAPPPPRAAVGLSPIQRGIESGHRGAADAFPRAVQPCPQP